MTTKAVYCWRCEKGHRWKDTIEELIRSPVCPVCEIEKESIANKYPHIVKFYDFEKNGQLPPTMAIANPKNYYWWKCENGHSYLALAKTVNNHSQAGCVYCDKTRISQYSL